MDFLKLSPFIQFHFEHLTGQFLKFMFYLTLSQADYSLNLCKVGKIFSQNSQNTGHVQTSQLIIYKKQTKYDNLITTVS